MFLNVPESLANGETEYGMSDFAIFIFAAPVSETLIQRILSSAGAREKSDLIYGKCAIEAKVA